MLHIDNVGNKRRPVSGGDLIVGQIRDVQVGQACEPVRRRAQLVACKV